MTLVEGKSELWPYFWYQVLETLFVRSLVSSSPYRLTYTFLRFIKSPPMRLTQRDGYLSTSFGDFRGGGGAKQDPTSKKIQLTANTKRFQHVKPNSCKDKIKFEKEGGWMVMVLCHQQVILSENVCSLKMPFEKYLILFPQTHNTDMKFEQIGFDFTLRLPITFDHIRCLQLPKNKNILTKCKYYILLVLT